MKISPSFFNHGREVDCLGRYQGRKRLSIRRPLPEKYEVYAFDYISRQEEILCSGTLDECVTYTNQITGYDNTIS